jgi:hypothetical protein
MTEPSHQPVRELRERRDRRAVDEQDELVAAETRDGVLGTYERPEALSDDPPKLTGTCQVRKPCHLHARMPPCSPTALRSRDGVPVCGGFGIQALNAGVSSCTCEVRG